MDGSNPKVSFIPKGSLVREDSFLERRRPKSVIGFIAGIFFVVSTGSYAALYYLNDSLNQTIATKRGEIQKAKEEFNNASEVGEARIFRARADLARELLNKHRVTSPVFTFLFDNTTESIMYEKFSFIVKPEGATLVLSGEAPSYAALAYQSDVLKLKERELSKFSIRDISLTKFGTIMFTLELVFRPDYLLYTKNLNTKGIEKEPVVKIETKPVVATSTEMAPQTAQAEVSEVISGVPTGDALEENVTDNMVAENVPIVEKSTDTVQKRSILRELWSKFKFW